MSKPRHMATTAPDKVVAIMPEALIERESRQLLPVQRLAHYR
ncbi:hypothetical protein [Carnimonas bestiolae]